MTSDTSVNNNDSHKSNSDNDEAAKRGSDKFPEVTPYGAPLRAPKGIPAQIRRSAQTAIRRYGMLTSKFRVLPDYMIIGTKRGGTTSLARWLLDHPQVRPMFPTRERRKGAYYFDVNYDRGEAWYKSHFPTRLAHATQVRKAGKKLLIGDSTPYYLHHPHAAIRARRLVPNAKIIVLLRNPVERAFGHWGERTRQGIETLPFNEALDAEPTRIAGEEDKIIQDPSYTSFAHQHYSYVDQGRYSRGLKRWLDAYPPQQLLILKSEDMYEDPSKIYKLVLDFLTIEDFSPAAFSAWNMKSTSKLDAAAQKRISSELVDDIVATETLIGRSMDWS